MWWLHTLVFLGALLFDMVPFPFAPAFTMMVFLHLVFQLDSWLVNVFGEARSVLDRFILFLSAPLMANKYLKFSKNEDIQFLGGKMQENKWKGQMVIPAYSLPPIPTKPLFQGQVL